MPLRCPKGPSGLLATRITAGRRRAVPRALFREHLLAESARWKKQISDIGLKLD
jgi:hypothetical protein